MSMWQSYKDDDLIDWLKSREEVRYLLGKSQWLLVLGLDRWEVVSSFYGVNIQSSKEDQCNGKTKNESEDAARRSKTKATKLGEKLKEMDQHCGGKSGETSSLLGCLWWASSLLC